MTGPTGTCWVYDFLLTRGGAESVTLGIARHWPQFDVWVATRNADLDAESTDIELLSSRRPSPNPLLRAVQTKRLFRRRAGTFQDYRQVVFSGMFTPVAQLTKPVERALYYCHTTPLPYAFDWQPDYRARLPRPARFLFDRFAAAERRSFSAAIRSMDRVIANSRFVAERYQHHLGIGAEVVYPPVAVDDFRWQPPDDTFVLIASLEPHKRVDLAVRAFLRRKEQLVVIGEGSQRAVLNRLAGGRANIHFLGRCDRHRVVNAIARCRATLCLSRGEAFGLAAVESLAAGKPVIAVADGAFCELIEEGVTGALVPPRIEAVQSAVDEMTPARAIAMRGECRRRAGDFAAPRFFSAMERILANLR